MAFELVMYLDVYSVEKLVESMVLAKVDLMVAWKVGSKVASTAMTRVETMAASSAVEMVALSVQRLDRPLVGM